MAMTPQRELVYSVVCAASDHLDAEAIYRTASSAMPRISVGTVYRNLSALCEAGMIRRIAVPDAPDRYDKNVVPHEHIMCIRCRRMFDLRVGEDRIKALLDGEPFDITGYTLTVNGICGDCKRAL